MSVELFGINIDNLSFKESLEKAVSLMNSDKVSQVVTINPEMIQYMKKHRDFSKIITESEMVIPDGIGVKIALKINGCETQRIPGIDFAKELLARVAKIGLSVGIVGAKEEIITKAVENLEREIPNLKISYYHNGYFKDDSEIYEELKQSNPRLILVAMGSPRQEEFIYNAKKVLNPALMVGIGGSLDVWSGVVKRAPKFFQKTGTEWLYRTITQPVRFKRIFPTLPLFIISAVKYKFFK